MGILDFIAVLSFGLTCFGIGYSIGKKNNRPDPEKAGGYFAK